MGNNSFEERMKKLQGVPLLDERTQKALVVLESSKKGAEYAMKDEDSNHDVAVEYYNAYDIAINKLMSNSVMGDKVSRVVSECRDELKNTGTSDFDDGTRSMAKYILHILKGEEQ